jgi:hypothetical protein
LTDLTAVAMVKRNAKRQRPPPLSQYKGLAWDKHEACWRVRISLLGKQHHLGRCAAGGHTARARMGQTGACASPCSGVMAAPAAWGRHTLHAHMQGVNAACRPQRMRTQTVYSMALLAATTNTHAATSQPA